MRCFRSFTLKCLFQKGKKMEDDHAVSCARLVVFSLCLNCWKAMVVDQSQNFESSFVEASFSLRFQIIPISSPPKKKQKNPEINQRFHQPSSTNLQEVPQCWGSQLYQWWDGTVFTHQSRMTFIESNASFLHLGRQFQSSWTTTLQRMHHCIQEPWIKGGVAAGKAP